jgi:hypothetical protein
MKRGQRTLATESPSPPDPDKQTITVVVFAPGETKSKSFEFDKHLEVGTAAKEAAAAFGLSGGDPTFAKGKTVLDRNKQLVAEGVRDGDTVELIDAGGGV